MTLKEELEILRGEPIAIRPPADQIPCIETSDAEKLCKNPMVSVHMITYNHEPYIRQAIEGVMMQQTDFEFELIIGEDCSQDKTREICFEYQKKYPDKIRVLWWHENVTKFGGNGRRVTARCRGEFIAFCEGDDYWTDPLKLQKQVDIMRQHPDVGLCFCGAKIYTAQWNELKSWNPGVFPIGRIEGNHFFDLHLFGARNKRRQGSETFIMTATTMVRRSMMLQCQTQFEVFDWSLCLGDTTLWLGLSSISNVYFLPDEVAVYNVWGGGILDTRTFEVGRDALLVRLYFLSLLGSQALERITPQFEALLLEYLVRIQVGRQREAQQDYYRNVCQHMVVKAVLSRWSNVIVRMILKYGLIRSGVNVLRYLHYRRDFVRKVLIHFKLIGRARY